MFHFLLNSFARPSKISRLLLGISAFFAAGYGFAADGSSVNVYTSRESALISPLFEKFTAQTGIAVNSIFIKDGLLERLKSEGERSPADLVLLVNLGQLEQLKAMGLSRELPDMPALRAIPKQFLNSEQQWVPLSMRARVFLVHKDLPLKTFNYADLADPTWQGKVCIRSGQHPYNIGLIAAMLAHEGKDKTAAWLKGVKNNLARKPSGGDRDVARDILGGICDIGLANSYYVGQMQNSAEGSEQRRWGDSVRVVMPTFANGKTHVNFSGIAIAKYARHDIAAKKLIEFMLSKSAQEFYAKVNFEYPILTGVNLDSTIAKFGDLKADTLPIKSIADEISNASHLVDETAFDR